MCLHLFQNENSAVAAQASSLLYGILSSEDETEPSEFYKKKKLEACVLLINKLYDMDEWVLGMLRKKT